jgi:hypothetical protein
MAVMNATPNRIPSGDHMSQDARPRPAATMKAAATNNEPPALSETRRVVHVRAAAATR